MSLAELTVENLRCLGGVGLELHPTRNLVWGPNGSGKTSVLEAIFILGRGRSFRTRNTERLIRHGDEQLLVFGRTGGLPPHTLGVQVSKREGTYAKTDGEIVKSLAELSVRFPVQVIEPGVHKLIEEGAHRRRRWLDWAVFHVEPGFIEQWTRYSRILKQRNAALRRDPSQAAAWDTELVRTGQELDAARRRIIDRLMPHWISAVERLTGLPLVLSYSPGWNQELDLASAVEAAMDRDRHRGLTHAGPHRCDIVVRVNGRPARDVLSRGQQKLAAIALITAQLRMLQEATGIVPTLLLDDPAAELDAQSLGRFVEAIRELDCQIVATSLEATSPFLSEGGALFHVEQGGVSPYNIDP